jgi:hypothetical protein
MAYEYDNNSSQRDDSKNNELFRRIAHATIAVSVGSILGLMFTLTIVTNKADWLRAEISYESDRFMVCFSHFVFF